MIQSSSLPSATRAPFATFITPVFNAQDTLAASVASAQNQTRRDIEIILIDDGSTDASPTIMRSIAQADERVVCLRQDNQGQGSARNRGLSMARGDYVMFLDSDDTVDSNLCAAVAGAFDNGIDVVAFGLRFVRKDGRTVASRNFQAVETVYPPQILVDAMLDRRFLTSPCCKAYRRKFLDEHGVRFPTVRAFEDVLFSRLVASYASAVVLIPGLYYHALVREGSTSRSLGVEQFRIAEQIITLERAELGNRVPKALLGAHVLRFFSHLLILAAFRVPSAADRAGCLALADRAGFDEYSRDPDALAYLSLGKRIQLALARRPRLLDFAAKVSRRLGYQPY